MNKHIWNLEIIFLCGLFVNLFVVDKIFLKLLFIFLLGLFVFKEKSEFILISKKYFYFGYGLMSILTLSILINYITSIYFITGVICAIVIYFYLYKILFIQTIGKVTKVSQGIVYFKIIDPFYKSKKEFKLSSKKKIKKDDVILVKQSMSLIKKPVKIISVVKEDV